MQRTLPLGEHPLGRDPLKQLAARAQLQHNVHRVRVLRFSGAVGWL